MNRYKYLYMEGKILNGIKGFAEDLAILSTNANHEKISIVLPYNSPNGKKYYANNIETLFQAAKSNDICHIEAIVEANDPIIAHYLGNRYYIRKDWNQIREDVMKELLNQKFKVSNEFRKVVLSLPKDKAFVNFNNDNDKFWGVSRSTFEGENKLGKLIMKLKGEKELNVVIRK